MTPLKITAIIPGALTSYHPVAFDALLAAVVAASRQLPPPSLKFIPVEVPLQLHERGLYHASHAHMVVADYELRHWARRLPNLPSVALLSSARRLPTAGRYKAFYMPLRVTLPAGARLTWWAVGDASEVADLLRHVHGVGGKRASGYGWVARWTVEECEADLSLLNADGEPARNLPLDLAPDGWAHLASERIMYPYWQRDGAELVAVPRRSTEAARPSLWGGAR